VSAPLQFDSGELFRQLGYSGFGLLQLLHFRVQELPQCGVWVAGVGVREGRRVSHECFALDRDRGSRQLKFSIEGTRVRRLAAERLFQSAVVNPVAFFRQSVDDTRERSKKSLARLNSSFALLGARSRGGA
jgi:hypothetical protein